MDKKLKHRHHDGVFLLVITNKIVLQYEHTKGKEQRDMRAQHTHTIKTLLCFSAFFLCVFNCCFGGIASGDKQCDQAQYYDYAEQKCLSCKSDDFYLNHPGCYCPYRTTVTVATQKTDAGYKPCLPQNGKIYIPKSNGHECEEVKGTLDRAVEIDVGAFYVLKQGKSKIQTYNWETFFKYVKKLDPDLVVDGFVYTWNESAAPHKATRWSLGNKKKTVYIPSDDSHRIYKTGAILGGYEKCAGDDINKHYACYAHENTKYVKCECEPYSQGGDGNGNKVVPDMKCNAGEYIPGGYISCVSCAQLDKNYDYKKGCKNKFSVNMSQLPANKPFFDPSSGDCTDDTGYFVYNEDRTKCVVSSCRSGFQQVGDKCVKNDNNSSSGSNTQTSGSDVQALDSSDDLNSNYQAPNDPNMKLESVECKKGEVWFNMQCTPCASRVIWKNYAQEHRVYCPGGKWTLGTPLLQQLRRCPRAAWPNDNLTGCECRWGEKNAKKCTLNKTIQAECECTEVTLTQDDLYYGPKGKDAPVYKQCWTKTTEAAYKACMGFDN